MTNGNGLRGIVELFDTAISNGLKYPKIRFDETVAGVPLVLKRNGEASRWPGTVAVTDDGRYPDNLYFGRIDRSGAYLLGRDARPAVSKFLERLASGAADVAGLYGQRTGNCCFCGKDLTHPASLHVGYGPDCAKKYSLPWGAVADAEEPAVQGGTL